MEKTKWSDYAKSDAGQLEYALQRVAELEQESAVLKILLEDWRFAFARQIGLPIDNSGDNLHWAAVAMGRIEVLERENAELREDKARLDWLEHDDAITIDHGFCDSCPGRGPCVCIDTMDSGGAYHQPNVRAAIDAARKEHPR